jgi:hypothetical protein
MPRDEFGFRNVETPVTQAETPFDQLGNMFTYHPPTPLQREQYELIRTAALNLARVIAIAAPPGPDRTEAVRKVREAVMTANAAIATGGQGWR